MGRLATGVRYAAPGVIVLDAGIRVSNVRNEHRIGGDWQREAALQAGGFSGSVGAGFRIVLYAAALAIPDIAFHEQNEEPGKVNPKLVNKYARKRDKIFAWLLLGAQSGIVLLALVNMIFGLD